jgi:hypothetical protein
MNYGWRYIYIIIYSLFYIRRYLLFLLFIHNLICLNYFLINCVLNNLLNQFACGDFYKPHVFYFSSFRYLEHDDHECGMVLETRVHCLN